MHMGNSHKHENSKDGETALGRHDILDKGERGGVNGVLDFRSKNGRFIGS